MSLKTFQYLNDTMSDELDIHAVDGFYTVIHIISVFGTLIDLFTLYTVVVRSPKEMREYARGLAILQVVLTISDHMVADGAAPFILFPLIGGVPYGWLSLLGIPTSVLTFVTIAVIGHTQSCTIVLFFIRWQFVLPEEHWLKMPSRVRYPIYFLIHLIPYVHTAWIFSFISLGQDLNDIRSYYLKVYPYFHEYIMLDTFYSFSSDLAKFVILNVMGFQLFNLLSMTFFASLSFQSLKMQEMSIEKNFVDNERKLIKALIIQVSIPMFTIVVPFNIGAIVVLLDTVRYTKYCPLMTFFMAQHGLVNSIATLFLYRPYRELLKAAFGKLTFMRRGKYPNFRLSFASTSTPVTVTVKPRQRSPSIVIHPPV